MKIHAYYKCRKCGCPAEYGVKRGWWIFGYYEWYCEDHLPEDSFMDGASEAIEGDAQDNRAQKMKGSVRQFQQHDAKE